MRATQTEHRLGHAGYQRTRQGLSCLYGACKVTSRGTVGLKGFCVNPQCQNPGYSGLLTHLLTQATLQA